MNGVSLSIITVIWFIYLVTYIKSILCSSICVVSLIRWGWMMYMGS